MIEQYGATFIAGLLLLGFVYIATKSKKKKSLIRSGVTGFSGDYERNLNYTINKIKLHPAYGNYWRELVKSVEYQKKPLAGSEKALGISYPRAGRIILFQRTYDIPKRQNQHISNFIGAILSHELSHVLYPMDDHSKRQKDFSRKMRKEFGFS